MYKRQPLTYEGEIRFQAADHAINPKMQSNQARGGLFIAKSCLHQDRAIPVSYTHLDVYKRQGLDKSMPATLKDMRAKAGELVSAMRAEMSASAGQLTVGASHAAGLRMAGAGTTVYNDNRMEQSNTYNVPVATPSEVAKKQREALRNMVGGVK